MSQHNIVGSEAFDRRPFVTIRSVRTGGLRRRRNKTALAFVAGLIVAVAVVAVVIAVILGTGAELNPVA